MLTLKIHTAFGFVSSDPFCSSWFSFFVGTVKCTNFHLESPAIHSFWKKNATILDLRSRFIPTFKQMKWEISCKCLFVRLRITSNCSHSLTHSLLLFDRCTIHRHRWRCWQMRIDEARQCTFFHHIELVTMNFAKTHNFEQHREKARERRRTRKKKEEKKWTATTAKNNEEHDKNKNWQRCEQWTHRTHIKCLYLYLHFYIFVHCLLFVSFSFEMNVRVMSMKGKQKDRNDR